MMLNFTTMLTFFFLCVQNLNKQAYDLAKIILKRTVQTIETCIANVCGCMYTQLHLGYFGYQPRSVFFFSFFWSC